MTKQVQRRRGTSTQHTSFTGAEGEISVNTTNKSIHVHDGTTAGGVEAARADLANVSDTSLNNALSGNTLASLTITSADINGGTIDGTTIGGTSAAAVTTTSLVATTADINGGTVDGAVIGGSSAAAITGTTITATGDVTIPDKIVHSGDTNTAIRFPAADTMTVETAGVERVRVTSAGNVGIGTTSPSALLHVLSTGDTVARVTSGNANTAVLDLGKTSDTDGGRIAYDSGNNLLLHTASVERVRVTSAGLVGIGTASPGAILELNAGTNTDIRVNTSASGYLQLGQFSNGAFIGTSSTDATAGILRFGTGGTTRATIDASGNVGIGTSSPTADLSVGSITSSSGDVHLRTSKTAVELTPSNSDAGGMDINVGFVAGGQGPLKFSMGGTERMRIDASGNVGIGTTSPSARLQANTTINTVYSSSNTLTSGVIAYIRNDSSTNATAATLRLDALGSANVAAASISAVHTGDAASALTFGTRTNASSDVTERARIDSSGNLLVGTTTASAKLTINSNAGGSSYLSGEATSFRTGGNTNNPNGRGLVAAFNAGGAGDAANTYGASITIGASSVGVMAIQHKPGAPFAIADFFPGGTYVGDGNPPTERLRVDGSGNLLVGTTTSPSGSGQIVANGGVYLGGSGSANLLDDYEEGTWTPSFTNLTVGNGTVFGTYTKVGRLVTAVFGFICGSTTSVGTLGDITGLPFASANDFSGYTKVHGVVFDVGSRWFEAVAALGDGVTGVLVPSIPNYNSGITATSPMTWTTNDTLKFTVTYYTT